MKLNIQIFFIVTVKPDWKLIKDHLSKEGRIEKEDLLRLVADCNKIMRKIADKLFNLSHK